MPGGRALRALAESFRPVVDGSTADLKRVGDLLGGESFGEPEHRLSPTPLLRQGGVWSTRSSSSPYRSSLKIIGAIVPPP